MAKAEVGSEGLRSRQEFGGQLRHYRTRAGLSQEELGRRLSRTQSYVTRIETGDRGIEPHEARRWLFACGFELNFYVTTVGENRLLPEVLSEQPRPRLILAEAARRLPDEAVETVAHLLEDARWADPRDLKLAQRLLFDLNQIRAEDDRAGPRSTDR